MDNAEWFDNLPVLGELPPPEAAAKLRELGEDSAADTLEKAIAELPSDNLTLGRSAAGESVKSWWPFQDRPWQHTAHAFGYIVPAPGGPARLPVIDAGEIEADATLKNSRLRITLDRLRIASYPGGGTHRVLVDFYAQNQVPGSVEHLHFNATFRVREGEHAGITGYPIFVGLNVGEEGVAFKCFTVNVQNDEDEAFLGFLESDVFKSGLKLASTLQPAIAPFSAMAVSLTKRIATRHRNVAVQDFYMGLDFSKIATRARLAEGSYIAIQIPDVRWDWKKWVYDTSSGQVISNTGQAQLVPYNYLIFSVSRYAEQ